MKGLMENSGFNDEQLKRQHLIDECIERGLPVLGDESIEELELFIRMDDDEDYFSYDDLTS